MRTRILILLTAVLVLAACGGGSKAPTRTTRTSNAPATRAVPARPAKPAVDPRHVAGDLIMTKIEGTIPSAEAIHALTMREIGGVILFGPNVQNASQLQGFTSALQASRGDAKSPVLVSVDQEGGAIRNVPFAPPEQTQPQLGAGTVDAAREVARHTGIALRAAGVNMDLGPVADLASGPNRTMAGRAFGSDAAAAATFVSATVGGMLAGGVIPTAKHFPGFGSSTANSDDAVSYIDRTTSQLAATELRPYHAAVAAHDPVIMVSHGILRKEGRTFPGTVDPFVVTKLLRGTLHFQGVAMTDSMNAKGFRDAWGRTVPQACPAAIGAGIDLLLLTGSLETAQLCRKRILAALVDGTLARTRFDQAVCRVTKLRTAIAARRIANIDFSSC